MDREHMYGVIVRDGQSWHLYGPLDKETADLFSQFVTREVDPATVLPMHSPARELLGWYASREAADYDQG